MGKRKKSSRGPVAKKKDKLPTQFTCLFCNHENSVSVKIDKKAGVGQLDCKMCGQKFQCGVNYLSAAVDVYGEWVDAAESVAKGGDPEPGYLGTSKPSGSRRLTNRAAADDDEEDSRRYEGEGVVDDDDDDVF